MLIIKNGELPKEYREHPPILNDIDEMLELLFELAYSSDAIPEDELEDIETQWVDEGFITSDQLKRLRDLVTLWGIR